MSAALFRQAMNALMPAGWSASDAGRLLWNLDGNAIPRSTIADWLKRDAVPNWVWPQLAERMSAARGDLDIVGRAVAKRAKP